jgi:hypothetical protein
VFHLLKRIPLAAGNLVESVGMLLGFFLILLAPGARPVSLSFLLYLVAWFCMLFFPHCLTHYVVGRLLGVKFRFYTLTKSSVSKLGNPLFEILASKALVLSLKVDRESLRSVSGRRLAVMFASGAVASMSLPFLVPFASLQNLPILYSFSLFALSAANLAFDLYYSPKAGDISRAVSSRK